MKRKWPTFSPFCQINLLSPLESTIHTFGQDVLHLTVSNPVEHSGFPNTLTFFWIHACIKAWASLFCFCNTLCSSLFSPFSHLDSVATISDQRKFIGQINMPNTDPFCQTKKLTTLVLPARSTHRNSQRSSHWQNASRVRFLIVSSCLFVSVCTSIYPSSWCDRLICHCYWHTCALLGKFPFLLRITGWHNCAYVCVSTHCLANTFYSRNSRRRYESRRT